ncbi:MAG: hypothetical protein JSU69_07930 [Candidatus Zixiibacteriota bacterium]|nr:MAG: hypothetical protein JSU69_07930 [candidate division Zixibacteria bacterium]
MDCKSKDTIGTAAKSLVVMTGVLAVTLFGVIFVTVSPSARGCEDCPRAILQISLPGGEGSMEKSEPTETGKSIFLTIPAVVGGQSLDSRRPDSKIIEYKVPHKSDFSRFDHLTTAASISSKKAMEFTLVGAKPSGTS